MCRDVNHGSIIAAPSVWVYFSFELRRAEGQEGSFAAVTVEFISPARTLMVVGLDTKRVREVVMAAIMIEAN